MTAPRPRAGLRERKKERTRQAIRAAAYRLFAEHGYDATRVDEIAEAAQVSPSTVFRYFPTKEDIVLRDEKDDLLETALRARPAHEPPLTALRAAVRDVAAELYATPEAAALARRRMLLVTTVPAVRARLESSLADSGRRLATTLADRTGRSPDDLELRVFVAAILAALRESLLHWVTHDHPTPLPALIDRALTTLDTGLR
ncbi:TetR family transcriptional regulator [Streptomyces sp. DSM 44917]|uniref:TetR family transcriptional regulator n=1 Tax=Streptomyces boetiae TaxID=3075541 RepID=A0ABU2LFJ1_9ACTN|nr:TetR family transcriptional regulator [Streptomyces sp. DSM 44917]MDT0310344.1 TetR family transcriptional regulator [Streptomyces sp. DSM 44917]